MTTSAPAPKGLFISFRMRLLLVFTLLFITVLTLVFFWVRNFTTSLALRDLQRDLRASAITAAAGIDGDIHDRITQSGSIDDDDYTVISDYLRSVKRTNPKAAGIYTFVPHPDNPSAVRFVVSAALPPGVTPSINDEQLAQAQLTNCRIPAGERPTLLQAYTDTTPAMLQAFQKAGVDDQVWPDEWGEWLSGFAPIYNSQGVAVGAVGVDMCAADIAEAQRQVESILIPIFASIALLVSIAVFIIAYRLTRPIINLTRVAEAIGEGRYDERPDLSTGFFRDEVDSLSAVVAQMSNQIAARETKLKQQVAELQIMVDQSKRQQQVDEIVDTDFFRDLQAKARDVRSRRNRDRSSEME